MILVSGLFTGRVVRYRVADPLNMSRGMVFTALVVVMTAAITEASYAFDPGFLALLVFVCAFASEQTRKKSTSPVSESDRLRRRP